MTELTLRDFNAIASGSYNAGIVDYRENANGKIELIKMNFFQTQAYDNLGSPVKPPATFASVIVKTLFNSQDAVKKMLKSLGGIEITSLTTSLYSAGKNELGTGYLTSADNITDKLQEKADQATDLSFDMEIGF